MEGGRERLSGPLPPFPSPEALSTSPESTMTCPLRPFCLALALLAELLLLLALAGTPCSGKPDLLLLLRDCCLLAGADGLRDAPDLLGVSCCLEIDSAWPWVEELWAAVDLLPGGLGSIALLEASFLEAEGPEGLVLKDGLLLEALRLSAWPGSFRALEDSTALRMARQPSMIWLAPAFTALCTLEGVLLSALARALLPPSSAASSLRIAPLPGTL